MAWNDRVTQVRGDRALMTILSLGIPACSPGTFIRGGFSELEIAYPHGTQRQSRVGSAGSAKVVYRELSLP
jgi:hypothetical protein